MKRTLLSTAALVTLAHLSSGQVTLLGHYELDETSGTTCADSSGLGHHGTYMNGVTLGQPAAAAGSGTAVDFDGSTGYVEIPGNPLFDALRDDLSIAAWVEADVIQLQRIFANDRPSFTAANSGSWAFGTTATTLRFTTLWVQDYDQAATINAGQYHHVAVTFDANFIASFYLDGVLLGQVTGNGPSNPPAMTDRYLIGCLDPTGGTPSEWFDGRIDDVQLYGGTLTAADVQFLFANPGVAIGGTLGTNYCSPAVANSTGQSASMSADGSSTVADDDLTLTANDLPNSSFGFFLTSQVQALVVGPGGSQGNLCLGGAIGRYVGMGQIQNSGSAGSFDLTLTLGQTPSPTGFVSIQPGQTWNFQCWYRDSVMGAATSNFTDGLSITFN